MSASPDAVASGHLFVMVIHTDEWGMDAAYLCRCYNECVNLMRTLYSMSETVRQHGPQMILSRMVARLRGLENELAANPHRGVKDLPLEKLQSDNLAGGSPAEGVRRLPSLSEEIDELKADIVAYAKQNKLEVVPDKPAGSYPSA